MTVCLFHFSKSGSARSMSLRLLGTNGHILFKGLFPWVQQFYYRVLPSSLSSSGTVAHVLEKGKKGMSLREKRQPASGGFLALFSPILVNSALCYWWKLLWSQFLCFRWQKNAANSVGFLLLSLAAGMFTQWIKGLTSVFTFLRSRVPQTPS